MTDQPDWRATNTPLAYLLALHAECSIKDADAILDAPSMKIVREILHKLLPVWYETIGEATDTNINPESPIPYPSLYDWARGFDWTYDDGRTT